MKALILAAGMGKRLNLGIPKALVTVCGLSLLERNILTLSTLGIKEFVIVVGFQGQKVKNHLNKKGVILNNDIRWVENEAYERGNAISILCAREYLKGHFLVSMVDHIHDPANLDNLLSRRGDVIVVVDSKPRFVKSDEATKVLMDGGKIKAIGKNLNNYNALDCGLALCSEKIFPTITQVLENGKEEWDDVKQKLAENHIVTTFDLQGSFWMDIDTQKDLKQCKKLLIKRTQKGKHFTAYLNKPIENKFIYYISEYSWITPNKLTIIANLIAYLATFLFLKGFLLTGSILIFVVSIMDGIDGKLARVRMITTKLGYMEHSFDLLFEQSWYIAFSWFLYSNTGSLLFLKLCIGIIFFDGFVRHCYMQFKEVMKIPLTTYGKFDRFFRKIDGRRGIYIIYILLGIVFKVPLFSLIAILSHSILTAIVYAYRACKHMYVADKRSKLI